MQRRQFITLFGGAAAAWSVAARAQQSTPPVIGMLCGGTPQSDAHRLNAFRQGLSEAGYTEGQNVTFEYRWAEQHYDQMPALAADLVRREVAVIMTVGGIPSAVAAKEITSTVPVLIMIGGDPVQLGLVNSLNRPGGNVTGVTVLFNAMGAKQLEALHETVPTAALIGFLGNPANPSAETDRRNVLTAAEALGQKMLVLHASTDDELETVFAALKQQHVGALVVGADFFLISRRDKIVRLAAQHNIPAIYPLREFAEAGGLMSYGTNLGDGYRLVGHYAARILRGEKPSELPVQQSAKVELIINLKTAKALGINVPIALLGRADEVIE